MDFTKAEVAESWSGVGTGWCSTRGDIRDPIKKRNNLWRKSPSDTIWCMGPYLETFGYQMVSVAAVHTITETHIFLNPPT